MSIRTTDSRAAVHANPADSSIIGINGQVTKTPAVEMLRLSGIQTSDHESLDILDNACGGGVVSFLLLDSSPKARINKITASDIDSQMLAFVNEELSKRPESDRQLLETAQMDQQAVPLPDASFSHIFSNMGVFFSVSDETTLAETHRLLKPQGIAAFTSWLSIAWFDAIALPALAAHIPEPPVLPNPTNLFPNRGWNDPAAVREKLEKTGFVDVEVEEFKFTPEVEPEAFAKAMAVLVHVVAKRFWSEGEFEEYSPKIEGALLKFMRERFEGGKWDGRMTAIVSKGTRSG